MKDKIQVAIFITIIFSLSILTFINNEELSKNERRKLTTKEELKEDFIENLDDYLSDQFPLRDNLIQINSIYEREILNIKDSKNAYIYKDYIIEKTYPLNENSIKDFNSKINYIIKTHLKTNKIYYSIIPDKSYFLEGDYLKIDYDYMIEKTTKEINANYIDIMKQLQLEDYYKTDIHIKQESYLKIIKELSKHLDFEYKNYDYETKSYNKFLGASYSKAPMYKNYDELKYMYNDYMKEVKVKHLEYENDKIYETKELESLDPYNIFLKGPSALIEIENENAKQDKELIIFRDSFASSLTPLLIPYYKKITLIDLRYIHMDLLDKYIDFNDQDILFLYSTLIINNSSILKVKQ